MERDGGGVLGRAGLDAGSVGDGRAVGLSGKRQRAWLGRNSEGKEMVYQGSGKGFREMEPGEKRMG